MIICGCARGKLIQKCCYYCRCFKQHKVCHCMMFTTMYRWLPCKNCFQTRVREVKSNGAESAATLLVPSVWKDCSVSTMPGLSWAPKPGFSSVGSSKVVQCRGFSRSTSTLKALQLGHPKTASLRSRFGEERIQATSLLWVRHHQERSQKIACRERFRAGVSIGGFHMAFPWLFQPQIKPLEF